jgi:hypothetical protein
LGVGSVASSGCGDDSPTSGLDPTVAVHLTGAHHEVKMASGGVDCCSDGQVASTLGKRATQGVMEILLYHNATRGSGTRPGFHSSLIEGKKIGPIMRIDG